MNQKAHLILETTKNDHTFQYHMPIGATWNDSLAAASELFGALQEHVKNLEEQKKADEAADKVE